MTERAIHGARFVFKRDPANDMLIGPDGCHHDTEAKAMYYDVADGCGCGDPEDVHSFLVECLQAFEVVDCGGIDRMAEIIRRSPETAAEYLAHVLTECSLLEHGSSARGSWLTELGRQFVEIGPHEVVDE